MSKFDSALETGYKRVVDVIEDFVAEAMEAAESERLPKFTPATSIGTQPKCLQPAPTSGGAMLEILQHADLLVVMAGVGGSTSEPRLMVPFCRSEDFVGREDILEKLEEGFTPKSNYQPRMALWGLGGVG